MENNKTTCYLCGKEISQGKRWYHADQDDLICLECAKNTKHTDTAYAGSNVSETSDTETILNTNAKFFRKKGTLTMMEEN